jgi:tetratricopeptide (TPR) repeat protein
MAPWGDRGVRQTPHRDVKEIARRTASIFVSATILIVAACASSQGRAAIARSASARPSSSTIQAMYESGEDRAIVNRVKNGVPTDVTGADRWFAAQSQLRLGLRNDAISDLTALTQTAGDPDVQVAAQLAIGRLTNDEATLAQARAAAGAYPESLFVQYELGLSYAVRNDFASAARIFDVCIGTAPTFAYAYYQAALAYQRLDRPDIMANRFDRFVRLAPNAPERPEVESVLRTISAGRQ